MGLATERWQRCGHDRDDLKKRILGYSGFAQWFTHHDVESCAVTALTKAAIADTTSLQPPPSFQPQLPPVSAPARPDAPPKPPPIDLIKRYNLESKVKGKMAEEVPAEAPSWSNSKEERQELLRKRREEMILKARRKMEEKSSSAES